MEDVDEIVREFLVESYENLDQLDSDLVALEGSPGARDLLSSVFRTIHTIKGTSGFLAFHALERVTHAGESLLVELRDGRRSMDGPTTDVLLRMVDSVRAILTSIEADATEGDVDVDPVIAAIRAVLDGTSRPVAADAIPADATPADVPPADATPADPTPADPTPDATPVEASGTKGVVRKPNVPRKIAAAARPSARARTTVPVPPQHDAAEVPDAVTGATTPVAEVPTPRAPLGDQPATRPATHAAPAELHTSVPTQSTGPAHTPAPQTPAAPTPSEPSATETPARSAADGSIRVDVDLLDALMRQVSELVLARNAIARLAQGGQDADLTRASQRLSLIASELQEGVMKTRMQPIEQVWSKVPRMVRDLAAACDRQVRLEMTGGDTELDRSLLEAIKDPLTHLVRNAVDHGIESVPGRAEAGKPAQGVLSLRAYHAGGQVVVEVTDDGKGIDPQRVAAIAVERGVRTAQQVEAMVPAELLHLLFLPGFSTAESVTNVSGRGVGMDVVRTKIEAIGGTVDVDSVVGRGTTWRLRIPLTLAIMPAVTVACAGQVYAIPQVSLLELVALDAQAGSAIEHVGSAAVYRLREDLLPLVDLRKVFGSPARTEQERTVIAVLQADTVRFGLLVDRVLNTEEIVVKPLSARLKSIGLFAGATLMGDGRVSLILDVQGLARRSMAVEMGERDRSSHAGEAAVLAETVQVLIAGIGGGRRIAIPLSAVTRLEQFPMDVVEHVGAREVMQYRGGITPVVRLDEMLGGVASGQDELTVVVCTRAGRSVALVVGEIIDIVDDDASHHSDLGDGSLTGSTVLKDRVTELLDIRAVVAAADPLFYADDLDQQLADELAEMVGA